MLRSLIERSPPLHRALGKARWYFNHYIKHIPIRIQTDRALRRCPSITFDISDALGLGAILAHAAFALRTGRNHGVEVALRFTSALYRPLDGPHDWLDCYFVRLGVRPDIIPTINSKGLGFDYNIVRDHPLLWSHLQIRQELMHEAEVLTGFAPFAAVHYRGSDKFMEDSRIGEARILRQVEMEMKRDNLDRLFVASDEASFIERAKIHFGAAAFWLPCEAMASGKRAAHFANANGEAKAREALITMVALSRALVCIRTPSFLSEWSTTLASTQRSILVR